MIDPALKHALRHLRSVKSQQPPETDPVEFAQWRERIAEALETVAPLLLFEEDRTRARAESEAARRQAAEIRGDRRTEAREGDTAPAHHRPE